MPFEITKDGSNKQTLPTALRIQPWGDTVADGFPKAREIIECHDADLRAFDRKLLNVILARSQDRLALEPNKVFYAHCADLRREVGWSGHKGNQEISDSLLRLQKTVVQISYLGRGDVRRLRLNLLTATDVPEREGIVYWRWNPDIAGLLGDPQHFARIFLGVVASLSGESSLRLYENLALYAQSAGEVEYALDDLRTLLAADHQPLYKSWPEFDRRLLRPALEQVNTHAPFEAVRTPIRGDRGKIIGVRFVLRPNKGWQGTRARITGRHATEARRCPVPVGKMRALAGRLSGRSLKRFAEIFPDVDLAVAALIWAEDALTRGREVKRPSVVFESWMRATYPFLKDGRTEPDLLWGVSTLAQMHASVRAVWIEIARRKARVEVPDASVENIHLWVEAVLDDLKQEQGYGEQDGLGRIALAEANQMELAL